MLKLWTFEQAKAAVPYIASIVRSLREHALQTQNYQRQLKALENEPGRPNRQQLIRIEELRRELAHSEEEFGRAQNELEHLDILSLDAIKGQAMVPFLHNDQLAWYIFDLFDSEPIRCWRYQSDSDEIRRKVTASQMI